MQDRTSPDLFARWSLKLTHHRFTLGLFDIGGVSLYKGGIPDDPNSIGSFKDWGIHIRVSFRENVKAQVLSARVHSGGERSVSTIMYLMALQGKMVSAINICRPL